ncbi:phosphoenolpyruvate--protein phosphotransferase [Demequina zhanjiangensis]|uniref:Phosphoenolpyruvate-protein phosphotransferase n=1 Tax=Demequina zhanjiangensis TaxID=3051659 RepID=A0ABT8G0S4_9MICO|nr:phosphoenolpyruvate--protein phosphotransferase [Demequina sp. SYSU T00b26]MDN4472740.1 phosphoenolpyruvate--protein phosphotransferase [Demequina sp. SYSU T00b26]
MSALTESLILDGVGVGRGCAVAPVAFVRLAPEAPADEPSPADPDAAVAATQEAFSQVSASLQARADSAEGNLAEVLQATALMAGDASLHADVEKRIREGAGPATAVTAAVAAFAAMFEAAGGYLAERVTDLNSVRDRVVARLLGAEEPGLALTERSIVAALDLSPADTAALDLDLVAGIVTELGGPTGHTAIIAGQLGIPCLVRVAGLSDVPAGTEVAVDAAAGRVITAPPADLKEEFARRAEREAALAGDTEPGATRDGRAVQLLANIGTPADAVRAVAAHAEGVGLFRTEVLFLDATEAPSEEAQSAAYRDAVEALGGRKLVVRTLDAGADKPLAFATQPDEENPALGVRGFRLTRILPELVQTQLDALGTVADESVWAMAPMIATPAEARDFASRAREAGIGTVGVMVEVPAAALRAEAILREVDFVSLGTNDLAQYTMATDRLRGELADLLDLWQPAVLELVRSTAQAGRRLDKPVGVCGESASDPLMALVLVGLGITSLSMSPGALPAVRFAVRQHTVAQCEAIALAALSQDEAGAAREAALALVNADVRDALGL